MLIYFLILFFLILFSCLNPNLKENDKTAFFVFLSLEVILILFSAIRYDVGVDYMNYKEAYDSSKVLNDSQQEFIFAWMFHLCNRAGIPFQMIVASFSIITVGLAFRFFIKYSPFVFFSVLIFFCFGQYYFNTFNAMRQTLVMYAFFNMLHWIEHRKWLPYFSLILVCSVAVHASAILLLPLYFLLHRKYSFWIKTSILILVFLSMPIIVTLIGMSNYAIYLKFDQFANDASASTYFLFVLSILFFVVDVFQKKEFLNKTEIIFFNLNFISLLLLMLVIVFGGTPLVMAFNRLSYYFTPVYIVLLPLVVARYKLVNNRILIVCALSAVFGLMCFLTVYVNGDTNNLVPYKTIFDI